MIGDAAIRLGGLVWLVEEGESIMFVLMGDIDFDAFAREVLEGIVVVFAVDGLIEHAILGLVRVIDVHRLLVYMRFFYLCVVKTVHYRYTNAPTPSLYFTAPCPHVRRHHPWLTG